MTARVTLLLSGFQNIFLPIFCINLNSEILWDHCNEALCHHPLLKHSGPVISSHVSTDYKEIAYKAKAEHMITKDGVCESQWRQFSSCPVCQKVSLVAKVDLWSYSFCHPSIHNLPRFSANSKFLAWGWEDTFSFNDLSLELSLA